MLKFGVAKRCITPETDMCIPGYFSKRFVSGVLDDLYAKAVAWESDGISAINVVCDTINLNRDDVLRIRRGIHDRCGVLEKNITASATHSHTAGPSWKWNDAGEHDPIYMNMLISQAIDAGVEAYEKRRPAKIGTASADVQAYCFIRRYKMKDGRYLTNPGNGNPDIVEAVGTPDLTFTVSKVCGEDGKIIAFISNYGVHLDCVGGENVSADYPGALAEYIYGKYGKDVESVFFTGPCGNTNHLNPLNVSVKERSDEEYKSLPQHKKMGVILGDALCEIEKSIKLSENDDVKISRDFVAARLRVPTEDYIRTSEKILHGEDAVFKGYGLEGYTPKQKRHIALATIDAYNNPNKMREAEITALTVGDLAMVFWPAEVFVEYGKAVRERFKGKNVLIAELSNGCVGCYLPTEEAIEQGGYEPTITGAATPYPELGKFMVDSTNEMLEKLGF